MIFKFYGTIVLYSEGGESSIFSLFGSSSPFATPIATVIPRRKRPIEITPVKPLANVVIPTF